MPEYETFEHDVLVIGAGGAGLRAAIEASAAGVRVGLVCKSLLGKAHTVMAEGGIAAALANVDERDNWRVHFADTMRGGQYVNQWRMAELHAKEAPDRVRELEAWGAVFDRTKDGRILQRHFGGHKYPRLAHVGDRTGLEMIRTLQDHGVHQGIDVYMEHTILSLLKDGDRVVGAFGYERERGRFKIFRAKAVVLATGGGEGWRLAMPAGAEVSVGVVRQGMVQIHVPGEEHLDGTPVTRGNYELRMRHGLVVNRRGQRFGNEYFFQALGAQLHAFETWGEHRFINIPCYLIFDHTLVDTYSFAGLPPGYTAGLAWVPQGHTLAELAQHLHLPAAAIEATVARFNAHARRGEDPDFHRPTESLGPIEQPPFYGLELASPPVSAGTIGLVTTPQAQVLHHETRQPILGLYACGQIVAARLDLGVGYQAGCQLMRALVHGFLAAEHAAGSV